MNFDDPIDRRGTHCAKWDGRMGQIAIADDTIPMWIADTDFQTPEPVRRALGDMARFGIFGYMSDTDIARDAVVWWMRNRHGWSVDPGDILHAHGLGNAIALLVDGLTEPGEGVMIFSPVYHEFDLRIAAAGRRTVPVPMTTANGRTVPDLDAARAAVDGVGMVIMCSPHNPGGQVWTEAELRAVADFARDHGLILISDEIHHDLVYPGARFVPMAHVAAEDDRLITLTAPSKTFNLAALRFGQIIVRHPALRRQVSDHLVRRAIQPNMAGVVATAAAYTPQGADWADAQVAYLDENRKVFDAGLDAIPGVRPVPLEATYLSWVDFTGTGMSAEELRDRVEGRARIAAYPGEQFGAGGAGHMRFNIGTQRARIVEAVARLSDAFSDLQ